jgi:surface protein
VFTLVLPIQRGTITSIDWGDGLGPIPPLSDYKTSITHNYGVSGVYTVSIIGSGITDLNYLGDVFEPTGNEYLISCTSFGEIGLINLNCAFLGCINLVSVPTSLPANSTIINLSNMFQNASSFNQDISGWNVSSVTYMSAMFQLASVFNQNISGWNVSKVRTMENMFDRALAFNQDLSGWNVSAVFSIYAIFDNSALSITNYNNILNGWSNLSQGVHTGLEFYGRGLVYSAAGLAGHNSLSNDKGWIFSADAYIPNTIYKNTSFTITINAYAYQFTAGQYTLSSSDLSPAPQVSYSGTGPLVFSNLTFTSTGSKQVNLTGPAGSIATYSLNVYNMPPNIVCFKEDTQILTDKGYKLIQDLKKGDMIKTSKNGFKAIDMIGKKEISHQAIDERIKDQLYKCSKDKYPEIFEDLVITGCHSILVDSFVDEQQQEKTGQLLGRICITDSKYRLPACIDNRTTVYEHAGTYTIYHIALENDDHYMNYGIYSNGLLVETCSKRYLKELADMILIE